MAKHPIHHVRHHAHKHHEAHLRLKDLLSRPFYEENVWHIFLGTFLVTIVTVVLFFNWGKIINLLTPTTSTSTNAEEVQVHGYQSAALSNYKVEDQATDRYKKYMAAIPTNYNLGLRATNVFGEAEEEKEKEKIQENTFNNSIWVTNKLSTGQHLTKMEQSRARALQKSMLATFYLGEKTVDINSTLQTDSQILSQINNALSVDLFQYLNQSENRADTLENFIALLEILLEKTNERANDLTSTVNFLQGNFQSTEIQLKRTEDDFFNSLQIFDGQDAEKGLADFIGLQENQSEIRAKLGAYQGLLDYYLFFKPKLENYINEIKLNRAPLIAGVKVVEVQNMTLPLIIQQR